MYWKTNRFISSWQSCFFVYYKQVQPGFRCRHRSSQFIRHYSRWFKKKKKTFQTDWINSVHIWIIIQDLHSRISMFTTETEIATATHADQHFRCSLCDPQFWNSHSHSHTHPSDQSITCAIKESCVFEWKHLYIYTMITYIHTHILVPYV